jgi:hypothetical protein
MTRVLGIHSENAWKGYQTAVEFQTEILDYRRRRNVVEYQKKRWINQE